MFPAEQGIVRIGDVRPCERTCTSAVPTGTPVTVRVAPDDGFVFGGWDDATPCAEGNGPVCTVNVPEAGLRLTPLFEVEPTGEVAVELFGPGRIQRRADWRCDDDRRCAVPAEPGTRVEIAVVPARGRSVAHWSVWECKAPKRTCSFTADQRQSVSVYLTPVTVGLHREGPGAVALGPPLRACRPACTRDVAWGSSVTARVTDNAAGFRDWGTDLCGSRTTCRFVAREPTRLTARFGAGGGGGGAGGGGGDPGPGLPAVEMKNLKLAVVGPGRVYMYDQGRYCRSNQTCTLPVALRTPIRLRADGPFRQWRSATCPKRDRICRFSPRYVDSVRAEFRR